MLLVAHAVLTLDLMSIRQSSAQARRWAVLPIGLLWLSDWVAGPMTKVFPKPWVFMTERDYLRVGLACTNLPPVPPDRSVWHVPRFPGEAQTK